METFELQYIFDLPYDYNVERITLADQKQLHKTADEFCFNGTIFIDFHLIKGEEKLTHHQEKELQIHFSRAKYKNKEIDIKLEDYKYSQEDNLCSLIVIYEVQGNDMNYEEFCSLDDEDITSKLRDYLHRDGQVVSSISLPEEKIILLDPVIEEVPHKVEIESENELRNENLNFVENNSNSSFNEIQIATFNNQDIEMNEDSINTSKVIDKNNLLKENYSSGFRFYRIKKGETLELIAERFKIKKELIISLNSNKEIKENVLIQLP